MKVLVTGSAGFIGRHLVRFLAERGDAVLGLDRTPSARPPAGVEEQACDVLDAPALARAVAAFGPEAVIHLAARTELDERCGLAGYAANTEGTTNVLAAIRAASSVRRCVWTSSQLVCRVGYEPRHSLDYQPSTLYGQSKVRLEEIVREADGGGAEWCLVRPTTIWGPGMPPHARHLFRLIERGLYVHVGPSALYKSYGYVGNTVAQLARLLAAPGNAVHRRTFYLADYEPISLRAWTEAFARALGAPRIRTIPVGAAKLLARCGDAVQGLGLGRPWLTSFRLNNILTEYRFDLTETERICGSLPYGTEEGVRRTVAWLRQAAVVAPA